MITLNSKPIKMKHLLTMVIAVFACSAVFAQGRTDFPMKPEMTEIWDPEVKVISAGETPKDAPSDAFILFDGMNLNENWTKDDGTAPGWKVVDGIVVVEKGAGVIKTKKEFNDFQLHIEWRTPDEVVGEGQGRGNSGIFLQGIYELQVLDNFNNRTYRNGQAGSIYKQHPPLVNACKGPGVWQVYDIIYTAPRFNANGTYFTPPFVTVLHNGVLVQNHTAMRGPTEYIGIPEYSVKPHGAGPIILQDHGNPVSFRNIWIREL
jgi:hypothetical protein